MLHEDVDIYFQKRTQVQNTFFFLGFSPVVSILLTALAVRTEKLYTAICCSPSAYKEDRRHTCLLDGAFQLSNK